MIEFTSALVRALISDQFPAWADLPVRPVAKSGHDNRMFHLGDEMAVRLPSGAEYAPQVEKEWRWLPYLRPHLPLPIPKPLAKGAPGCGYPFPWLVQRYLPGEAFGRAEAADSVQFARDLARFLLALQAVDASAGPAAGPHNFYRGGDLAVYEGQALNALGALAPSPQRDVLAQIWR